MSAPSSISMMSTRMNMAAKRTLGRYSSVGFRCMSVTSISDLEAVHKFTEVNSKSVLYFTATWCPPCKTIKPLYEELSDKYGDIAFAKIDIDENQDAAMEHQISSVPTFVFFSGNQPYLRFSGADKEQLESVVKDLEQV